MIRIGILGDGQLGQMMSLAATPLDIDVSCFGTSQESPAARAGEVVVGSLEDIDAVRAWANGLDVLTYESENNPAELLIDLMEHTAVHPGPFAIAVAQDRWAEKRMFDELDIPVAPFRTASTQADLDVAVGELGYPVVVKTRTGGYDGKGQARLYSADDLPAAEALLEQQDVIVEAFVDFDSEMSIIGVRSTSGEVRTYPVVANVHRDGILHTSTVPSGLSDELAGAASDYIGRLLKRLDYVGVLTLEMFITPSQVLANEMAPRVHNSGHWTIEGAETSQFENHLRAIAGLPLGSTAVRAPSVMINIIGTAPDAESVLAIPGAALHLYGKSARPGRKLGHITVTGRDAAEVAGRCAQVEALLA